MNRILLGPAAVLLAASSALCAQTTPSATDLAVPSAPPQGIHAPALTTGKAKKSSAKPEIKPFSRLAFGGGVSAMGVNMQAAVNLNRYLNLRGTGNLFNYTVNNINVSGFVANARLNLASAGASLDIYPFPRHGLRLSPGVLFENQNEASATVTATGGTSFTLNDVTYYSSATQPVQGIASLGLHRQNPAPAMTLGWGNMIPRNGGHWAFPVEVGAAYIGQPAIDMALTSGQVCSNPQGTVNCQNVVGNADVNANLQAQIAKYKNDLQPFRFYPVVSFGVSYNFRIR